MDKVDTRGRRLSDLRIRKGLRVNIVAGSLGMGWVAVALGMPLVMLLEALGASGVQIGLSVTVQQLAMVAQVPGALFAERLPQRKVFWAITALVHRSLWFLPAALPWIWPNAGPAAAWALIATVALSAVLAQAASASWFSWMADLVPEAGSGRFWGRRQAATFAAYLVAMLLAGWALDQELGQGIGGSGQHQNFALVFFVAALVGVGDILVHLAVPEPRPASSPHGLSLSSRLLLPLRDRDFRNLTLGTGWWMLSVGLVGSFGIVYLRQEAGLSYLQLSLVNNSAALGTILLGVAIGHLVDRLGGRAMVVLLCTTGPLFGLVWFFVSPETLTVTFLGISITAPQPAFLFAASNFFAGGLYSGVGLCQMHLAGRMAPAEGRTVAMAMHWTVVGLMGALGPLLGGLVMDRLQGSLPLITLPLGCQLSYVHILVTLHIAVAGICCSICFLRTQRLEREPPVARALSLLAVGNPIRTVGSIYNMIRIHNLPSASARLEAVRRFGVSRSELAVDDLVDHLEDPDPDVREESALALGRIGNSKAVDVLVKKLEDGSAHDLGPQLARALRLSRAPSGVDVLLRKLAEPDDRATLHESVRALGDIGDARAAEPLRHLLRNSEDLKLRAVSGDALARLGVLSAVYDILPQMKQTRNPVLRSSLAVAMGDLLGAPGRFYTILKRERDTHATEASRLCRQLRANLRKRSKSSSPACESQLQALLAAYEQRQWRTAALALHEIAKPILAQPVPTPELQQQADVGGWFLTLLGPAWPTAELDEPDQLDVLLALHFLTDWSAALARQPAQS